MADEKDGMPSVDVGEGAPAATSYAAMHEVQRDTTDDGWGKGVYADQQSDGTARPVPIAASAPVPDIRRSRTASTPEDDDAPPKSPMVIAVAVVAGVVIVVLTAALAFGYV